MVVHVKRHLSLLSFKFACLHIWSTLSNVSSWSFPCSLKPSIKMSSAILNTFEMLLNSSSILFWNMSPDWADSNEILMYVYLLNGWQNVAKNYDFLYNLRLWSPEFASINVRYITPGGLSRILSNVGHLCTGILSALFSLVGSRHNHILPKAGTITKLLHHCIPI